MAYSMTGIGMGEVHRNKLSVSVELKSVNNRFLEVSCRMPSFLNQYENDIRAIIREHISRGKIYVLINIQDENDGVLDFTVDPKMVHAIHNLLNRLKEEGQIQEELKIDHFLKFSEIFQSARSTNNAKYTWESIEEATVLAVKDLKTMRKKEGKSLVADIKMRIDMLREILVDIEKIAADQIQIMYNKMLIRVKKLLDECTLQEDRLYIEIALMVDKMDITEECVRLKSHNEVFMKTLNEEEIVGKKLTFLLQEMNREANTIGSKAANYEISQHVVQIKEEIEKLREQVQNLE